MINSILSIVIGYLLGCVLMAYVLGKVVKGIDIREHGSGNPGTMNSFTVLGPVYGIITLVFDLSKGVVAILIAQLLGVPTVIVFATGLSAVAGHTFPFYLKFKGGKGEAASYGILVWLLIVIYEKFLNVESLIPFAFFVFFGSVSYVVTRSLNFTSLWGVPALLLLIFWRAGFNLYTFFAAVLCIILLAGIIITIIQQGGLKKELESHSRKNKISQK